MRVLFLLHAHPELQAGGSEIFARDLFRTLRNDFGVDGLFLAGTAAHQRQPNPGTPFQTVGSETDELLVWTAGFDPFFMSQIDLHGVAGPITDLLIRLRPDVVHIHHLMTVGVELVGLVRRVLPQARIVMTLHDYYALCANDGQMVTTAGALCYAAAPDACRQCFPDRGLSDFCLRDLHIRGALEQIDQFIAPSHFLRDRYIAWGLPANRIVVLHNGLPAVDPAPARSAIRRDRFVFFGHINRFKGVTVALEASARLSREGVAHGLTVYGGFDHQTPETRTRFDRAREAAPDAHYCGAYRRSTISRLIADADWVVFPSEWWENAPLVIQEAFQHRRPVLCSGIGGIAEAVHDQVNGLHVPVSDASALAAAMRRGIEEPGLWERLRNGIQPPVSLAEAAASHRALYDRLVATAAPGLAA